VQLRIELNPSLPASLSNHTTQKRILRDEPVACGEALPAGTRLTLFSDDQAAYAFFQRFDPEVRVVLPNLPSRETTNSQERVSSGNGNLRTPRTFSPAAALGLLLSE
jgi:hypothetical protein